jgi:hypothetical protein
MASLRVLASGWFLVPLLAKLRVKMVVTEGYCALDGASRRKLYKFILFTIELF